MVRMNTIGMAAALVALGSGTRTALAAADPFAGDSRAAGRRTIRLHDRSIRDVLADLNLQTGIRFFADPAVAEDRITLIAHDRPLGESLRAVAEFLRFEWKRDGAAPDFGYTLRLSEAAHAEEERSRWDSASELARRIADESATWGRLENSTDAQLAERENRIAQDLNGPIDSGRRRELALEQAICGEIRSGSEWKRLIHRFIRVFSTERIAEIVRDGHVEYSWPPAPGYRDMPASLFRDVRENSLPGGPAILSLGPLNFIRVRFTTDFTPDPVLKWVLTLGRKSTNSYTAPEFAGVVPTQLSLGSAAPEEPAGWRADPSLSALITARLDSDPGLVTTGAGRFMLRRRTLGEALEALDSANPIDVVSDGLYSTRIAGFRVDREPLGEALNRLGGMTLHRWWKEEGFIFLRSLSYESDRRKEPPATSVNRWSERTRLGILDLDDLAEIASLPDLPFSTFLTMSIRGDFPEPMDAVGRVRDHLRLWNTLSSTQRRKARATGIPVTELSSEARTRYMVALRDPRADAGGGSRATPISPTAKFRIETREGRFWGVRVGATTSISGVSSREDATQQFRRQDPSIKPSEVKSVVYTTIFFLYEDSQKLAARAVLTLPAKWEDRDPAERQ